MGQLYWEHFQDHELARDAYAQAMSYCRCSGPNTTAIAHHSDVKDHRTVLRLAERARPKIELLSDKEQASF